jgi:hypothetical protein
LNERDFAELCRLKARLEELERRFPMNAQLKSLHKEAFAALCKLRGALRMTEEQFKILATPMGGGTDKPPPEED